MMLVTTPIVEKPIPIPSATTASERQPPRNSLQYVIPALSSHCMPSDRFEKSCTPAIRLSAILSGVAPHAPVEKRPRDKRGAHRGRGTLGLSAPWGSLHRSSGPAAIGSRAGGGGVGAHAWCGIGLAAHQLKVELDMPGGFPAPGAQAANLPDQQLDRSQRHV